MQGDPTEAGPEAGAVGTPRRGWVRDARTGLFGIGVVWGENQKEKPQTTGMEEVFHLLQAQT